MQKEDLTALFGDVAPRFFNIEVLEQNEFKTGSSMILIVVEKENAVSEAQDVIGKLDIKSKSDFEKYKKRAT